MERVVVIHYPYKVAGTNYECLIRATVTEYITGGKNVDQHRYEFDNFAVTYPEGTPEDVRIMENGIGDNLSVLNYLLQEWERLEQIDLDLSDDHNEVPPIISEYYDQ